MDQRISNYCFLNWLRFDNFLLLRLIASKEISRFRIRLDSKRLFSANFSQFSVIYLYLLK